MRTPGARARIDISELREVGVSSSTSRVSSVLLVVEVTSTTGAAPDTVTVSATVARLIATSILAMKPTVSRTSWRWAGRKLVSSNAT